MSYNSSRKWDDFIESIWIKRKELRERTALAKRIRENCRKTSPDEEFVTVWLKVLHTFEHSNDFPRSDAYMIKGVYHEEPDWKMFPLPYNCIRVNVEGRFEINGGAWLLPRKKFNDGFDTIEWHGMPDLYHESWCDCEIKEYLGDIDIAISFEEAMKKRLI